MALDISLLQSELNLTEQVVIGLFYWVVLLTCWTGNLFVLYGTIRHKAVKLDRLSVWLVQNLAIADMCHGVFHILPTVITASAGYCWVLGPELCKGLMIIRYVFIDCNSFLINFIVINKLYRCLRPLSPPPSRRVKLLVSFTAVLGSNLYTIVTLDGVLSLEVEYIPYLFGCGVVEDHSAPYRLVDVILTCIVVVVPSGTLITLNSWLIVLAYSKGTTSIKKANLLIVGTITFVYVASNLPYFFWMLQYYKFMPNLRGLAMVKYTRFVTLMLQLSCFVNPLIYYHTNTRFRYFTHGFVRNVIATIKREDKDYDWMRLKTSSYHAAQYIQTRDSSSKRGSGVRHLRSGSVFSTTSTAGPVPPALKTGVSVDEDISDSSC